MLVSYRNTSVLLGFRWSGYAESSKARRAMSDEDNGYFNEAGNLDRNFPRLQTFTKDTALRGRSQLKSFYLRDKKRLCTCQSCINNRLRGEFRAVTGDVLEPG